jgi:dienelactone hydrolase
MTGLTKTAVGEVPILLTKPASGTPAPLVLLSHGFTGCKENWLGKLDELTGKGFVTAAMDNRLHGERSGIGFDSLLPWGKLDLPGLRRVMQETAAGVGRELTAEMWANAVAWLEKYL